ncbi:MAG TPA: ferric reductase-like transmembrane domain-containing protein [Acidimicrobiales bacterium]|nr:ferric reductase-like transmembrane domain-containing protein [Acidimicrobiales bacterium]
MNPQTWWYVARATGFVAWGLVTTSVITGLLLSTRLARGRPRPAWTLDLHRFLGGTAVVASVLHLAGLVGDSYIHFGAADLFVPFASAWEPGAVALGIVALYLLLAVQGSSMLMRRLPRRLWRIVHLSSFIVFWTATFHLQLAGTDATNPVARWTVNLAMTAVVFLTLVRVLAGRGGSRRGDTRPASGHAARPSSPASSSMSPATGDDHHRAGDASVAHAAEVDGEQVGDECQRV